MARQPKVRIWIAGPRSWDNKQPIDRLVGKLVASYGIARLLVMAGGAPGVDTSVEKACAEQNVHVFACKACWPVGRGAGPIRNAVIAQEFAPHLLIALHYFPLDATNHRGTQSAIKEARRAHVPVKILRFRPETALPGSVDDNSPMGNRARAERGLPPKPKKQRRKRSST